MKAFILKYKEILLYVVFGVLTTAINYIAYIVLAHSLGINVAVSNGAAWLLSVIFAFITNKLYVFESKSFKAPVFIKEFLSFVACRLFSGFLDMGIMIVFVNMLHLNDFIVKIGSNIVVVIINYVLSKLLIFKRKESAKNG